MANKNRDGLQRYVDAGINFTNVNRARAEEFVQQLVQNGEVQRSDARAKVDELLERSRKSREALLSQIRREVSHQLDNLGITNIEDLAKQVAAVLQRTAGAGRSTTAQKKAPAKKTAAKKAPAKKTAAKKTAAKKTAAKKAPAEKAVASGLAG
ncbi:MAG: phasin family protein [Acidimicrobiales bacterium]